MLYLLLTGQVIQTLKFPVNFTTSCCFGGPNYDELYVTSARAGKNGADLRKIEPQAGSVFKVTGLGTKGLPPNIYEG